MYFSRVSSKHAADLSNKATMNALSHSMTQLENDSKHIVFEFKGLNEKRSFDRLARNEGYGVDVYNTSMPMTDAVQSAIDQVLSGSNPNSVLETATSGMLRAYSKLTPRLKCSQEDCLVTIPSYVGRYPKLCPACGSELVDVYQETKPSSEL